MTEEVRNRIFIMDQLTAGQITNAHAANMLGLSVRQIKRIKKEMQSNGIQALGHGNAGRKLEHALDPSIAARIAERCTISASLRTYNECRKGPG